MKYSFRSIIVSGAVLAAATGAAYADEPALEARVQALEALVQELKAELEAEKAEKAAAPPVEQLPIAQTAPAPAPVAQTDGFMVGDTHFKVGGFIDVDAHVTSLSDGSIGSSSIARDFYIPGATPIGGDDTTTTDITAQASRFFVEAARSVNGQKVTGRLEMDFLGSLQGDERVTNSFSPRLRLAYVDTGAIRIGQDWSTFQNTSAIPESASFLTLSDGMIFIRQPLVRYTAGNFQIALENPDATITTAAGARIEADSNNLPDIVARYNWKGEFGNVSFAALGRELRYETAGVDETTAAFGASASGQIKVGAKDDVRFNVVGGEGVGRYVGLNTINGAALNPVTGELEAIPVYGGYIAWRHPFGDTARFNIGYSGLFADNPDFLASSVTKSVQSAYGAILWDVAKQTTMGVELLFGQREDEAGNSGDLTRFTFSTKMGF